MTQEKSRELTYDLICKAINGDEVATEKIMNYYEPYIITLSKIPFYSGAGEVFYKIDEDIYMHLKLTLQEAILTFKIA